jgi:hypothetical protein
MTCAPIPRTISRISISAILVLTAALSLLPLVAKPQTQSAAQSPEGLWLTDGYGELIEFHGDTMSTYELTKLSCVKPPSVARRRDPGTAKEVVFSTGDTTYHTFPGATADSRWLHVDSAVSKILLRRTSERPKLCGQPIADTPVTNYQVFWETFAEQYPFFALHHMDWLAADKKFRPQVTLQTKPEDLFRIFRDMIDPLHDAHTSINAPAIQAHFSGYRPSADPMQKKNVARITQIIETKYLSGGSRDFCNKKLQFGMLHSARDLQLPGTAQNDAIGYLRMNGFSGYSDDQEFLKQVALLESALDDIFKDSSKWTGLVIDLRITHGGSDVFGISIASRLATKDYVAYSKVVRNDINDPDHRTPAQVVMVHVSKRPSFHGQVVLLTSADAVSAAETFTQATLGRRPHMTRLGDNTQGVYSDPLGRTLPNGWTFGLPNEIYLTPDGKSFDGPGIPPDIRLPIFPAEDLANGRDSIIEKAMAILNGKS